MHGVSSAIPNDNTFWLSWIRRNSSDISWENRRFWHRVIYYLCTWYGWALLLIELNLLLLLKVSHLLLNLINVIALFHLLPSCSVHWPHELCSRVILSEMWMMPTQRLYILIRLGKIYWPTSCSLLRLSHSSRIGLSILLLKPWWLCKHIVHLNLFHHKCLPVSSLRHIRVRSIHDLLLLLAVRIQRAHPWENVWWLR
jgi:hypothetical protein